MEADSREINVNRQGKAYASDFFLSTSEKFSVNGLSTFCWCRSFELVISRQTEEGYM